MGLFIRVFIMENIFKKDQKDQKDREVGLPTSGADSPEIGVTVLSKGFDPINKSSRIGLPGDTEAKIQNPAKVSSASKFQLSGNKSAFTQTEGLSNKTSVKNEESDESDEDDYQVKGEDGELSQVNTFK